jgi:hypothetical protein
MRKWLASLVLVGLMPVSAAFAESWTCQSAECTGQKILADGTVVDVSLKRTEVLPRPEGVTVILLTGTWHHNP